MKEKGPGSEGLGPAAQFCIQQGRKSGADCTVRTENNTDLHWFRSVQFLYAIYYLDFVICESVGWPLAASEDLIRYDAVYLRTLKRWQDGQLNLAHGIETKKIRKTSNKSRVAEKKRSG